MAVPKKKTSKSRRNMRRSHLALGKVNVVMDSETGEYRLPHRMALTDPRYKGRQVLTASIGEDNDSASAE